MRTSFAPCWPSRPWPRNEDRSLSWTARPTEMMSCRIAALFQPWPQSRPTLKPLPVAGSFRRWKVCAWMWTFAAYSPHDRPSAHGSSCASFGEGIRHSSRPALSQSLAKHHPRCLAPSPAKAPPLATTPEVGPEPVHRGAARSSRGSHDPSSSNFPPIMSWTTRPTPAVSRQGSQTVAVTRTRTVSLVIGLPPRRPVPRSPWKSLRPPDPLVNDLDCITLEANRRNRICSPHHLPNRGAIDTWVNRPMGLHLNWTQ